MTSVRGCVNIMIIPPLGLYAIRLASIIKQSVMWVEGLRATVAYLQLILIIPKARRAVTATSKAEREKEKLEDKDLNRREKEE